MKGTKGILATGSKMGMGNTFTKMEASMKVIGKMAKDMARGSSLSQMGISTWENGKLASGRAMVSIFTAMEMSMTGCGKTT